MMFSTARKKQIPKIDEVEVFNAMVVKGYNNSKGKTLVIPTVPMADGNFVAMQAKAPWLRKLYTGKKYSRDAAVAWAIRNVNKVLRSTINGFHKKEQCKQAVQTSGVTLDDVLSDEEGENCENESHPDAAGSAAESPPSKKPRIVATVRGSGATRAKPAICNIYIEQMGLKFNCIYKNGVIRLEATPTVIQAYLA